MKKALGRWGQKAGENIGMVRRTTEVDEDFTRHAAATDCRKDVQEKLVRHLTPESMKSNLFSKNNLSEEEKMGEFLLKSGNTLASTSEDSVYASALITLGEMLKEIGEQHRQTDQAIDERTIQPMKHYLDTKIKDINQFKKRNENCRLDYEREKRASEKKGESEALHQAAKWYEESKEQYLHAMVDLQDCEDEQVTQLQAYVDTQVEFHQKCVEVLREASSALSRKAQEASSRPKHNSYTPSSSAPSYGGGDSTPYSAPAPAPAPAYGGGGLAPPPAYGGAPAADPAPYPPPEARRAAPPPPPARGGGGGGQRCSALYDFAGEASGELTFHAGDVITITNMVNAEWAEGELWGQKGIFPLNYVQML